MALPLTLHVFSGSWSLPSVDPASINAACYLQLAFPGRWSLCESNDPDSSPNGQLPYLQHGPHLISSLPSILIYLAKLAPESVSLLPPSELNSGSTSPTASKSRGSDLDEKLSEGKRAEGVAWKAVIEGELADLSYCLFSPTDNYALFHDHLAQNLSFPQSHYLPNRLRAVHQQRLLAVGLWDIADAPASSSSSRRERDERLGITGTVEKLQTPLQSASKSLPSKFGEQELIARAQSTLSLLSTVLASSSTDFFFDSRAPTTTDLYLFSNLSLILLPPFPSATLPDHIRTTYPNLQAHTLRVLSLCFPPDSPNTWPHRTEEGKSSSPLVLVRRALSALPSVVSGLWSGSGVALEKKEVLRKEKTKKEKEFARTRLYWFAGLATTFVVYLFASGLIQIDIEGDDDEEEEEEEGQLEEAVEGELAHGQE
ncbi:hypothetical protein BDY24DRAFT_258274 [Mrakia frigida]|uniref:uncharacterized protein n=1 Tax=Mrakia frigida TaxID=29902 RepID=UPI003FCBF1CF